MNPPPPTGVMFSQQEIENFRETLLSTLRKSVETGNRVLPSGFAFYRVSPGTGQPKKSVGSCYGHYVVDRDDVAEMATMVQTMALAGHAHAAGMALIVDTGVLPGAEMFGDVEQIAVMYLDNIRGAYEVWYAPVLRRPGQNPTLGPFELIEDLDAEVPHLLPIDLYGPVVGSA